MTFHNRDGSADPEEEVEGERRNDRQQRQVLEFFARHPAEVFTPDEVHEGCGLADAPLTSVRRAITDLTTMRRLVKYKHIRRMGRRGKLTCTWQYNSEHNATGGTRG